MWIKTTSHRSRAKVAKLNVRTLTLVNWPSMQQYTLLADGNKEDIRRIKGISILNKRPAGSFTRCWTKN